MQLLNNLGNYQKTIQAEIRRQAYLEIARRSFLDFVCQTMPSYIKTWFNELLSDYLQKFALGKIKKLMVFMPPQHGKSQLVSRHLPAYLLGTNPRKKVIGCSYSSSLSQSFNRDIKRLISDDAYAQIFPDTKISSKNVASDARGAWLNNSEIFEIMGFGGFYKNVGVGGSLTGTAADVGIIDDPVKDAREADSPTIRQRVWDWYDTVFSTRLHNDSQQLLTMTRWHRDDLAGRILKSDDAENWEVLKLPAIKEKVTHHILDTRKEGEALWEARHSAEKILSRTERTFKALYQQDPMPPKGGLVFDNVRIVNAFPSDLKKVAIGIDWGYSSDPCAAVLCGLDEKTKTIYCDQLIYQTHLSAANIAKALKGFEDVEMYCDHDERIIKDLNIAGFRLAKKAIKGAGSIVQGIALLQEYTIAITKRSSGGIAEAENYTYKTDANGSPTETPIDDFNHFFDALRYYAFSKLTKPQKGIWLTK
jgi:hypothetical protein